MPCLHRTQIPNVCLLVCRQIALLSCRKARELILVLSQPSPPPQRAGDGGKTHFGATFHLVVVVVQQALVLGDQVGCQLPLLLQTPAVLELLPGQLVDVLLQRLELPSLRLGVPWIQMWIFQGKLSHKHVEDGPLGETLVVEGLLGVDYKFS